MDQSRRGWRASDRRYDGKGFAKDSKGPLPDPTLRAKALTR